MENFMDKLAEKFSPQDIIKANSQEPRESRRKPNTTGKKSKNCAGMLQITAGSLNSLRN